MKIRCKFYLEKENGAVYTLVEVREVVGTNEEKRYK